jgi:hypothetical protein
MSLLPFGLQRSATNVRRFSERIAKGPQPSSARTGRRGRCTGRRQGSERHWAGRWFIAGPNVAGRGRPEFDFPRRDSDATAGS